MKIKSNQKLKEKSTERITLKIPRDKLLTAGDNLNSDSWIKRSEKMWAKAKTKAEKRAIINNELYREQLREHVKKHHFLKRVSRNNWVIGCWLGKEPTGRLFKTRFSFCEEGIKKLADDMWDFLFTPKGEQIIRKEYESNQYYKQFGGNKTIWQNEQKK